MVEDGYYNAVVGLEQAEEYARKKMSEPKIPSMANFNHKKFQQALYDECMKNAVECEKYKDNPYLMVMYAAKRDAFLGVLTAFQGAFEK